MRATAPAVGDLWEDSDHRSKYRKVRVIEIDTSHATVAGVDGGPRRRIKLERFGAGKAGYTFVGRVGPEEPLVAGETAAARLLRQVGLQARVGSEVSPAQVITVLRALADHSGMEAALQWRSEERPGDPAFSTSTWMHAVADQLERELDLVGAEAGPRSQTTQGCVGGVMPCLSPQTFSSLERRGPQGSAT